MERNVRLEGKYVIVEEVQPKYFEKIIEWRNNPEFNKFLNQPYKLTMELQQKWYANYLEDETQGLFVAVDRKNNKPFATIGYTDYDKVNKVLISGRLLVGEIEFRGSKEWDEVIKIVLDYFYNKLNVEKVYAHVVKENIASICWHKKWGYIENKECIKYPSELIVNGMDQNEYIKDLTVY